MAILIRLCSPRTLAILLLIAYSQHAMCDSVPSAVPWRPVNIIDGGAAKGIDAKQAMAKSTYSDADSELLFAVVKEFTSSDATDFLASYIGSYSAHNSRYDVGYARAIFCLGIAQTDRARELLFDLWRTWDNDSSIEKINKVSADQIDPHRPIADALHFYLHRKDVRDWFDLRIEEIPGMAHVQPQRLVIQTRRTAREYLIMWRYRWDIIESVDALPKVSDIRLSQQYFFRPSAVQQIDTSAKVVAECAARLSPLKKDMDAQAWNVVRQAPGDYQLDNVTSLLGRSLAISLWKTQIGEQAVKSDDRLRLWLIAVWAYMREAVTADTMKFEDSDKAFLSAACDYFSSLPNAYVKTLGAEAIYKAAIYISENSKNSNAQAVLLRSGSLLDENERMSILSIVNAERKDPNLRVR